MHFVKLPNFLSVETRPFDPETYEDEIEDEETLDEEGRARYLHYTIVIKKHTTHKQFFCFLSPENNPEMH